MTEELEELFDYENELIDDEKKAKLDAMSFDNCIKSMMNTPWGRKFMYGFLYVTCNIEGSQFTGNSRTYFNEGMREPGRLLSDMVQELAFDKYLIMLREGKDGVFFEQDSER